MARSGLNPKMRMNWCIHNCYKSNNNKYYYYLNNYYIYNETSPLQFFATAEFALATAPG